MNDSIIFQLRDLARTEINYRKRKLLKDAADTIDTAIKAVFSWPTTENMQTLNGAWAFGVRVLKTIYRDGGDDTPAGRMEVPQQERRAA